MASEEIKVRGFSEFFEIMGERSRVASNLKKIRNDFRGADFNPALVRHATRQILLGAPDHPLAIPSAVSNILRFLSVPADYDNESTEKSRRWARDWARSKSALALFAQRWAKRTGVPLRKSRKFV